MGWVVAVFWVCADGEVGMLPVCRLLDFGVSNPVSFPRGEQDRAEFVWTDMTAGVLLFALSFSHGAANPGFVVADAPKGGQTKRRGLPDTSVELKEVEIMVDQQPRRFLVTSGGKQREESPRPLVFVFHGHGGTAVAAARKFGIERLWPEAVVVYPQGLPTPGQNDLEGKRSGWQKVVGDQDDRDLKFFDALRIWVGKEEPVDSDQIYCTGHSNGGGFTYLVASVRPGMFAAIGPSAAGARGVRGGQLLPVPTIHIAGRQDSVVPFSNQVRTVSLVRRLNGCDPVSKKWDVRLPWAEKCEYWSSPTKTPVILCSYDGDHKMPDQAVPLIVEFFRQHPKPKN